MIDRNIELGERRSLHVVQVGEGPDLVLIHGALATGQDWMHWVRSGALSGFRMTAVDRPGHGESLRPRFEGTPREQARQIRDGLETIGIQRTIFVGHSFGGLVALAMAEQFPEAVAGLVLVAPIAFPEVRVLEHGLLAPRSMPVFGPLMSKAARATTDRPMLEMTQWLMFAPRDVDPVWKAGFPHDQVLDAGTMVAEGEDAAAILPFSPAGTLAVASIRAPTRVLTGTGDRIVVHEHQGKLLARLMPGARVIKVPGEGHMIHHGRPDLVAEAVRSLVADAPPANEAQPQSSAR